MAANGLMLRTGTVVDATLISAPSSTTNASGERKSAMHQTKNGKQLHFAMKAHIGADPDSGLAHTVRATAANVNDLVVGNSLLHGDETEVFGDAHYREEEARKRTDATEGVTGHITMGPAKRQVGGRSDPMDPLVDEVESLKTSLRAKVGHSFSAIQRWFKFAKIRGRSLKENTARLTELFALSILWLARGQLTAARR